jgi:hypothetical protein
MPYWLFYIPVYLFALILGVRHRSLTFFTAANPGFRLGGFVDYSKWEVQKLLPDALLPRTLRVTPGTPFDQVLQRMRALGLGYPVIVKPDRGERGLAVEKAAADQELAVLLSRAGMMPMLVQEFLEESREFGVLYMRAPGRAHGMITSVVIKEPLTVTGDGERTLEQLIARDERCRLHREMLGKELDGQLGQILRPGEVRVLAEIGNHVRGATFLDGNHLITKGLRSTFDRLARGISGFNVGRFDVRARSEDDLAAGRFRIIELNGVNSEPAHIYHPGRSILLGYRDLFVHWYRVGRISAANMRNGAEAAGVLELVGAIRGHMRVAGRMKAREAKD